MPLNANANTNTNTNTNPRAPTNLRRRRLLRSAAGVFALGAGLAGRPAYARDTAQAAAPPATATPSATRGPSATATPAVAAPSAAPGPLTDPLIPIKPREAWGAAPPVQPYVPHTPRSVLLHHTGAAWNGRPAVEQYLRNIQTFHTGPEREWEDIAYHFLIDLEGGVWAGRPPEVRGNPSAYYDSLGYVLICFLGDYDSQELSAAQVSAASSTAAWLIRRFNLPAEAIGGHRDRAPTTCPGGNVYRLHQAGEFVRQVRALLR